MLIQTFDVFQVIIKESDDIDNSSLYLRLYPEYW